MLTRDDKIERLLRKHAFGKCTHPDCQPRAHCASGYIRSRAMHLAREAVQLGIRIGRERERAAQQVAR